MRRKQMQRSLLNTDTDTFPRELGLWMVAPARVIPMEADPPRPRGHGHRRRRGRVTAGQAVQLIVKSYVTAQRPFL